MSKKLKPENIEQLSALIGILRPDVYRLTVMAKVLVIIILIERMDKNL